MDLDWSSYALHTELLTSFGSSVSNVHRFTIKTRIFSKVLVSFSQSTSAEVVDEYSYDEFPAQFDALSTNEASFLHAQVHAAFEGDKDLVDQPASVYLTLQKDKEIAYSVHADYIPAIKRYQIFTNL